MIKKIVLVPLFFFGCLTMSLAQSFQFGIQASPTFSWMSSSDSDIRGNGTNLGLKLGLVGENYFQENYAFLFGINFAFNQGGTLLHDIGGTYWSNAVAEGDVGEEFLNIPAMNNVKYSIQYVEIPLGFKMRTREFGYIRYYAILPVFNIGIATQARGELEGMLNTEDKENIIRDVNPFSISWGLGGGLEYSLSGNTKIFAGVGYNSNFLDVTRDKGAIKTDGTDEDSNGNFRNITIMLGVMF